MPETEDLYEILHLHPSAHPDVIQAAYRRLALLYHPDRNPSPEATAQMAAVNRAYAVLSDPEKRAAYDRTRAAQASPGAPGASAASATPGPRPRNSPRNTAGYFTLGSTKEQVADIHGPPRDVSIDWSIREEVWHYGNDDTIEFDLDTGKVQGWSNIRGNLRIRLIPGPNVTSYNFFTEGDHRDEVARLQGTPPMLVAQRERGIEIWMYSVSSQVAFSFSTGRVIYLENGDGILKARRSGGSLSREGRNPYFGNWRLMRNEYNPRTRSRDVTIYTVDPVDSEYHLIVRFKERELGLYIIWGTPVSYSDTMLVRWQIDEDLSNVRLWDVSTNHNGTFLPDDELSETIRQMFTAQHFKAWVTPSFGGTKLFAMFRTNGFADAFRTVFDAMSES